MALSLLGVSMIGKLVKSIFMLGFYAAGLCAVVGIWDYTRQAKDAGYEYSFDEYTLSVTQRYGKDAEIGLAVLDVVKAGAMHGLALVDETGLLAEIGLVLPQENILPSEAGSGSVAQDQSAILVASAASVLAPETSLYPRARTLP